MLNPNKAHLVHSLRRLFTHLSRRRRWQLAAVLCLMVLGGVAELATLGAVVPFLMLLADPTRAASLPALQGLFAAFGWNDPADLRVPATIVFALAAISACAVRLLSAWVGQKFIFRLGHDLSTEVYRRSLYQPYGYHLARNTSEIIAAIQKSRLVAVGVLMPLMQGSLALLISVAMFIGLCLVNWLVAILAAMGFGTAYTLVSLFTRRRLSSNSQIIARATTDKIRVAQEGLGGIRDVLLDRAQPIYVRKFATTSLAETDAITMNSFVGGAPRFVVEAFGMVMIAILALWMAQGSGGLVAALPTMGAFALGAQRLLPLVQQIYAGWSQIIGNQHSVVDVLDFLDLPVRTKRQITSPVPSLPFRRDIRFNTVNFGYEAGQPNVIECLNMRIGKGERVALIGKTGSGKSTIMDLTMGLLTPTTGTISVDDTVIRPDNVEGWQSQIAHVPQSIYLADATLGENIAFAAHAGAIDWDRVREAARTAQIADFIENLPHGYSTQVGERGVRLSGGQRQRIGLARALYRRASVLVLDEATSALDNQTETAVINAIRTFDRSLTILLVAHRLSTIDFCDRVLEVCNGKVSERGENRPIMRSTTTSKLERTN